MTEKRALVTGGAGFIGSHIVDALIADGYRVTVVDDLSSGKRENLPDEAVLEELDIRSDEMGRLIADVEPDVLVHAAAQMSVRKSMEDPVFDADVNVKALVNILSSLRRCELSPKIAFLSTGGAIYGEQDVFPANEDHPIRPTSIYGLSKRVGEMYLDFWTREFSLPVLTCRLSNVYGPRQNPHGEAGVVAIFHEKLMRGETATIYGDGSQTRDFVYVEDVASAVISGIRSSASGVFNIGTGVETSVQKLYELIATNLEADVQPEKADARLGEQQRSCIDPARAKDGLSWKPAHDIEAGMRKTSAWYRASL